MCDGWRGELYSYSKQEFFSSASRLSLFQDLMMDQSQIRDDMQVLQHLCPYSARRTACVPVLIRPLNAGNWTRAPLFHQHGVKGWWERSPGEPQFT
jgi:hypothetical protein